MPDASGRIKGIAVPRIPWHEDESPCMDCGIYTEHGPLCVGCCACDECHATPKR